MLPTSVMFVTVHGAPKIDNKTKYKVELNFHIRFNKNASNAQLNSFIVIKHTFINILLGYYVTWADFLHHQQSEAQMVNGTNGHRPPFHYVTYMTVCGICMHQHLIMTFAITSIPCIQLYDKNTHHVLV